MASRESMNMGSQKSNIISEFKSLISFLGQETDRAVQKISSGLSRASSFVGGGGPSGPYVSSNQVAPNPSFPSAPAIIVNTEGVATLAGGRPVNNAVFSGPSNTIVPASPSAAGNLTNYVTQNPRSGTLYTPAYGGGGATGGGGGGGGYVGGGTNPANDPNYDPTSDYYSQGNNTFGYNSSGGTYASRFLQNFSSNFKSTIAGNPLGSALAGFGIAANLVPSTASAVEANLLQQRAAFFSGTSYNQAVTNQSNLAQLATLSSESPELDAMRAIVAAQSYGMAGTSASRLLTGAANVSNLLPGLGLEGSVRAAGSMQQARNVNMLRGIGIQLRDEMGNLKGPDEVIDQIWQKICRDYAQAYGAGKTPKINEIQIALQPGNSLDSMLDTYFGSDPLLKQMVANGLIFKAQSKGGAITRDTALQYGATTQAVETYSARGAAMAGVLGGAADTGVAGFIKANEQLTSLTASLGKALAESFVFQIKTYTDTMLAAAGGTGGTLVDTLVGLSAFKAEGGPVTAASTYIVGEKGPEIFVPASSGVIISNEQIRQAADQTGFTGGGISNNTYNFTVNIPNANTPEVIAALKNLLSELDTNKKVSES